MKTLILIVLLLSSVALYSQVEPLDTDGDGRRNVKTLENLRWISEINLLMTEKYELDNDIDASDTKNWNDGKGFKPIGNLASNFVGLFDGQGYKISNLYIYRPDEDYVGFFGYISIKYGNLQISNLSSENCDIIGNNYTGSIAGFIKNTTVNKCSSVNASVKGKNYVGGLVGYSNLCFIYNSIIKSDVIGESFVGGLVGQSIGSYILLSESEGKVSGKENIGGFIGLDSTGIIQNCSAKTDVYGNNSIGGFAGVIAGEIDLCFSTGKVIGNNNSGGFAGRLVAGSINACLWDSESSSTNQSAGGTALTTSELKSKSKFIEKGWNFDDIWDITDSYAFINIKTTNKPKDTDGNGVLNIENLSQLRWLSEVPLTLTDYYELSQNIDANDTRNWNGGLGLNPLGNSLISFKGYFNGNHYVIKNLYINRPNQTHIGLFGRVSDEKFKLVIENIGLENCKITGKIYVGSLVAYNFGFNIRNCFSKGNVNGVNYVGGLIGVNSYSREFNDVNRCFSEVIVNGTGYSIGGLIGGSNTGIVNSYSSGTVTGNENVGGIVGYLNNAYIVNSYSLGRIYGKKNLGGIVGVNTKGNATTSIWNIETSGLSSSPDGIGKTTEQMKTKNTYTDIWWDFNRIWDMDGITNDGYPFLRTIASGVEDELSNTITNISVYPNPIFNLGHIKIVLNESDNIRIELRDLMGRPIKHIFSGYISKGEFDSEIDASDISSGIYFCIIQTKEATISRKFKIIK